jgi:hypothetical protein
MQLSNRVPNNENGSLITGKKGTVILRLFPASLHDMEYFLPHLKYSKFPIS